MHTYAVEGIWPPDRRFSQASAVQIDSTCVPHWFGAPCNVAATEQMKGHSRCGFDCTANGSRQVATSNHVRLFPDCRVPLAVVSRSSRLFPDCRTLFPDCHLRCFPIVACHVPLFSDCRGFFPIVVRTSIVGHANRAYTLLGLSINPQSHACNAVDSGAARAQMASSSKSSTWTPRPLILWISSYICLFAAHTSDP